MNFWISFGVGAFFAATLGLALHTISVNHLEAKHKDALAALSVQISNDCSTAKLTTEGISHAFQNDLRLTADDYDFANGRLPQQCTAGSDWPAGVVPLGPSGYDGAAAGKTAAARIARAYEPRRVNGIVHKGQVYQKQLKWCQAYVGEARAAAIKHAKTCGR